MKPYLKATVLAALLVVPACQPTPVPVLPAAEAATIIPPKLGVWINRTEIAAQPTTGRAWLAMVSAATKRWGTPTIADQTSTDDTDTLAGALVGIRTNNAVLRSKVREHLMLLVRQHPYGRVLGLARQLPSYVIAADIVGLNSTQRPAFEAFLRAAITHDMEGHSGGTDLLSTALLSPNNWGTMSRAAMAAVAVYLGDQTTLIKIADTQKAWLGGSAPNRLRYTSTNWHVGRLAGINARGSARAGRNVDGVLPEDQRRTGDFAWPAPRGSYPHEALQGAVVASTILHRAGVLPFNAGDRALARAQRWLAVTNGNPSSGDDLNTPWLLALYGNPMTLSSPTSPAKNIAWSDWTAA